MGRIYAVPLSGTLTAAGGNTDLFSLAPASNKPIRLRGFRIGQISEVGDAAEEGIEVTVKRLPATFTVGSGGNAVTAITPMADSSGPVWGFTARTNDTTIATTSGTAQIYDEIAWNERVPMEIWYPDNDFCPGAKNGEGLIVRCETTVADDLTFVGVAFVEEFGS